MHKTGIVAYTASEYDGKVTVTRAFAGQIESITTDNWQELADFLTDYKGVALHICWNLPQFSNHLFSILPQQLQDSIERNAKTTYEGIKIFSTEHLLGITMLKPLRGNTYDHRETNFYAISHWLPTDITEPADIEGVEYLGYQIIDSLAKLGISPTRLTSPVALFCDTLDADKLPTIYNFNEDWIEVMDWANQVAGYEWNHQYKKPKPETHQYDLSSAYPALMLDLPDTRYIKADKTKNIFFQGIYTPFLWGILEGQYIGGIKILPIDNTAKYFTTEEINWVLQHKLGEFKLGAGWFFIFKPAQYPYRAIVSQLLQDRGNNTDDMMKTLAKRIANGLSGKFDQINKDGSLGEFFNPILALMVRSRNRLKMGDFIYDNQLQDDLLKVEVDSVYTTKNLQLPETSQPGQFRRVK